MHSHASQGLEGSLKEARQLIAQGITTVALNPDGGGTPDLRTQRAGFEQRGVGVNVALYVPHGAIRREVLGMADRAPTRGRTRSDGRRSRRTWHGSRRHRPVVGPLLRARQLREDRRSDRAREGRRRDGRRLREPHPRRGRLQHRRRRRGAGSDSHRRRRALAGRRRAHEGARAGELGPVDGAGRADRRRRAIAASRSTPISIPTTRAAPASSARSSRAGRRSAAEPSCSKRIQGAEHDRLAADIRRNFERRGGADTLVISALSRRTRRIEGQSLAQVANGTRQAGRRDARWSCC